MDQLHGEVGSAVGERAQLVDRNDARVLELAADLGLLEEASAKGGVVLVMLEEDLDGQLPAEVLVSASQHGPHAAAGNLAEHTQTRSAVRKIPRRGRLPRRLCARPGVFQANAGDGSAAGGDGFDDARRPGQVNGYGALAGLRGRLRAGKAHDPRTGQRPCYRLS